MKASLESETAQWKAVLDRYKLPLGEYASLSVKITSFVTITVQVFI